MAPSSPPRFPVGAYYLTIFGGIVIALVGVVLFFAGVTFTIFFYSEVGATVLLFSIVGVVIGLLLIGCAWMLKRPNRSTAPIGVLIVLLAGASLPFTFGGFGIGFLLALIGGVLAIVWKPASRGPVFVYEAPGPATIPNLPSLQRVCPACGARSSPESMFCSKCGTPFA